MDEPDVYLLIKQYSSYELYYDDFSARFLLLCLRFTIRRCCGKNVASNSLIVLT